MSERAFLLDSNVWVASTFDSHPAHQAAGQAILQATNKCPALFCRATQQSYLRLVSTPALLRVYGATGLTNRDALKTLLRFMAMPLVAYHPEPVGLEAVWHKLAALPSASPKVWMDAYLAAFAIAGDLTLVTIDRDFKSFEQAGVNLLLLEA